jgi:predicted dehydrogenase
LKKEFSQYFYYFCFVKLKIKVMLNQIRWGIIGVGNVCEVKSAPALNLVEGSQLVAVMRRNGEKARDFAERHGVLTWYADADALINDPNVNAIYIATPPDSHAFYTLKAAEAKKPVYVEKPMARTHEECLAMINACQSADVPLFTAYYRRALPNFVAIKNLLNQGVIGDVRYVHISLNKTIQVDMIPKNADYADWRVVPEIAGGGYFFDLAAHQLDLMDFLFGEIENAQGFSQNQAKRYPAEDIVVGSFQFKNSVLGTGNWCFTTAKVSDEDKTTIIGSKGQISFPTFGDNSVTIETDSNEKQTLNFVMPKHIQQPLIQTIVNELLGNGQAASTGVSGARTNKIMQLLMGK